MAVRTAPASENLGGSETILLVEDEDRVRFIVSEMLEWYGYTVLRAPGAAEAVALARSHSGPIHLLLTDVVMPRLSGRALRDEISIHRPRIPVLYMSGYAGEDRSRELLTDGAAFLAKPFTAAALARALLHGGVGEAQARMLEELHRHEHRAVPRPAHQVGAREELGQPFLHRLAHLLVVAQPVARPAREKLVPGRFRGNADRHSWASKVVT